MKQKMQLDVDIEPILRFPGMTSIDIQMDQSDPPKNVICYRKDSPAGTCFLPPL